MFFSSQNVAPEKRLFLHWKASLKLPLFLFSILSIVLPKHVRAENRCACQYFASSNIYLVGPNLLKILQFSSCKSAENWLSYPFTKFEIHVPEGDPMAYQIRPTDPKKEVWCTAAFIKHLGEGITQSVLNGFEVKKSQNIQRIRGHKLNITSQEILVGAPVLSPKWNTWNLDFVIAFSHIIL